MEAQGYKKLVEALRLCQFGECGCGKCFYKELKGDWCTEDNHPEFFDCDDKLKLDAATAIEDLEGFLAEAERDRDEYEERMRKEQERVIELQAEADALKHDIERYVGINAKLTTDIEALHGRIEDEELKIDILTTDNINCEIAIDELKAEIEALQAAVKILKVSGREAYFEGLAADDNGRQVEKLAKRNAELHAELEKWVSAAEKAGEPKRGKWIGVSPMVDTVQCSVCGGQLFSAELETPYCPYCGAEMIG